MSANKNWTTKNISSPYFVQENCAATWTRCLQVFVIFLTISLKFRSVTNISDERRQNAPVFDDLASMCATWTLVPKVGRFQGFPQEKRQPRSTRGPIAFLFMASLGSKAVRLDRPWSSPFFQCFRLWTRLTENTRWLKTGHRLRDNLAKLHRNTT